MNLVKLFRATRSNKRFRANQKVWISREYNRMYHIVYRFQGKGRMVGGKVDRDSTLIGEIKEIEVDDEFAERIASYAG